MLKVFLTHSRFPITAHVLSRVHIDLDHLHIPALMGGPKHSIFMFFWLGELLQDLIGPSI